MKALFYILFSVFSIAAIAQPSDMNGSWINKSGEETNLLLIQDGYATYTTFTTKSFKYTRGGKLELKNNEAIIHQEFNSAQKECSLEKFSYKTDGNFLILNNIKFEQIKSNPCELAGVWKIDGRKNDSGEVIKIQQTGTRKTLKLLTDNYFHWFAIDTDGNKFFGTGGGTYTFSNEIYTEHILFFSKDNSRVGTSLNFNDKLVDEEWIHTGNSSIGKPIYEIWKKTVVE